MNDGKNSYSVLIVSGSEKSLDYIGSILPRDLFYPTVSLRSAGEAKRLLISNDFDIIIINTPLRDDLGVELAKDLADDDYSAIMLLVKAQDFDSTAYELEDYGVLCVPKPISTERILQTLRLMTATRSRLLRAKKEKETFRSKMEEIRIVNRAKWVLINDNNMSESEAHRYIEKHAMNECATKKQIALNILKKTNN